MHIFQDCTIKLSPNKIENIINLKGKDYQLKYINDTLATNKGGNSNIFLLYDPHDDTDDFIIKLCKANLSNNNMSMRVQRFRREIAALKRANNAKLNNVIKIYFYGKKILKDSRSGREYKFYYHVTERAEYDLRDFIIEGNVKENISEKIKLCKELMESLKQLHSIGIYHRDIKPENILVFKDGSWKMCDLGLIEFRDNDYTIDRQNELIGPKGWLSPEATNKYYTYGKETEYSYDCKIDGKSDIYQLGNLFWFVFQTNIPLGKIARKDFKIKDDSIYSMLMWMLNHNKVKRPDISKLDKNLRIISRKYI